MVGWSGACPRPALCGDGVLVVVELVEFGFHGRADGGGGAFGAEEDEQTGKGGQGDGAVALEHVPGMLIIAVDGLGELLDADFVALAPGFEDGVGGGDVGGRLNGHIVPVYFPYRSY